MTLSVRLEPDIELAFAKEVERRKTTKSQFVNDLLREILKPEDPMKLLLDLRQKHGLLLPGAGTPRTQRSAQVNKLVRQAARKKFDESRIG